MTQIQLIFTDIINFHQRFICTISVISVLFMIFYC